MNDRETRRYDMFGRVQTFGQQNAADFTPTSQASTRFGSVGRIIDDLDAAKAGQQGGGNTAKSVLLDALRLDVQNIARTARAIDLDEPGFADNFRTPASPSDADLLTTADAGLALLADATGDDAATLAAKAARRAKFVANELPAGFATDLAADRAAIAAAQDDQEGEREDNVESTAAVGRLIREGMKEVTYLNAIMHNKYTRNADKLRAWQSASHIERAPQRETTPPPPPTPPPTPPQ